MTNRYRLGFTDHEHLNEQQIIHMNGRVYDYNMGRFMSVDPLIQSPTSTQSINPYSYIMNNPLAGTDPTGYAGCAASCIQSKCDTTLSQHGGHGKADEKFFGGSSRSSGTVKSNGGGNYTASFQLNKTTSLEVDFKVNDIGGQGSIAQQGYGNDVNISGSKDAADEITKLTTGVSMVVAGLDQTKDLALLNTSGAGTLLMATGSTGNAWAISKNAKSNLVAVSLDGSKLASKLAPQATVVGLVASLTSNALNKDATRAEAVVKSGVEASMALIGLRGGVVGTAVSIGYALVDVGYPGGVMQLNNDVNRNISNFSKRMDKHRVEKGFREEPINTMKRIFGIPVINL